MHPVHASYRYLLPILILLHTDEGLQLHRPDPYLHKLSCMDLYTRIPASLNHTEYLSKVHIPAPYRISSHGSNLRTLTLSCRSAYPLFSTVHNTYSHRHKISQAAHTAPPSVPSYSSSPVRRTSYYTHNRCYISPDRGTGQSSCINTGIPMSCCHKSYRAVHSADVFRN